jgi:cytochrome c556
MTRTRIQLWAAAGGVGLALAVAGAAISAGNPVEERQAAMKQIGQSMKDGAGLAGGATAWDAAKAKAAMGQVAANAKKLHGLFPKGSDADPKTAATPKIWETKADFDKRLDEMGSLATAAGKAATLDDFKAGFGKLGGTCKGCHDAYRKKKT